MSTNISKKKRDDLLDKIKQIRAFIAAAPQDENTGNLLSYLYELEKDVNGKKYGLVFEEHREEIDEVLDTHTPVLTEDADLFIDHGGQMNFLLEGDNLAALKLLEKTHRGKIDLIYIDPPYNTGNKDFIYDDAFVDKTDGFIHSKWISFMNERLKMARHLLSPQGALVISIGYQEIHNLNLLCQDIFFDRQIVTVTVQTSGGKPNGGFNYTQEYLLFVVPVTFSPSAMNFTGGIERSPFEGLTLSTFDKITRPNQTYPIFIEKSTMKIVGVGKSLAERIANGSYTGDPRDFTFDFDEAPEGAVAIWPISSKGADCVWRLISTRLLHDWELGYIKVSKNKSKACPNEYSLQYLPDGVIRKIEAGVLEIIGREDNLPTLKLGKNETVGSEIPTIWTEKDFFTTKGSTYVRNLFGDKRFPYPKSLEFIVELLRATTTDNSLIVDFFAGSGTTGEAAMLLNRETDGSRRFILCTNNENGICRDVTYERIRRVIDKEDYAASLKYYKVDYVPISDRIYFYYLSISKHKDAKDDSAYSTDQIIIAFSQLLEYIMTKGLPERKKDITSSEKVVWLDSYEDLKNGNYDVIFKSAKYNHVRNEIDTETMQERGRRKRPQDGDEEKTHLCIRLAKGENRFLAVHESNHYGITLKCIIDYLNEQFKKFNEDGNDPYHYTIESQIMPGEDFLSSIKRAKTMSVLKLTVYKDDIKDGFMRFAGRTDIADEVDICLKRPKGYKCFPENLIKEYFKDSQDKAKGKIKRIKIIGTNDAGSFEVDTNITGMKHFLKVKGESVTNEVESSDFFVKAQEFIASMGGRI